MIEIPKRRCSRCKEEKIIYINFSPASPVCSQCRQKINKEKKKVKSLGCDPSYRWRSIRAS